jgi:hypothetical protein
MSTPTVVVVETNTGVPLLTPVELISGKGYLRFLGTALLVMGIAELISGIIVIADSSGYYVGGTYVGIIAILTGSRANAIITRYHLGWFIFITVISLIVSIIGLGIQGSNLSFIDTLEACSSYDSAAITTSCSAVPSYYTCTGNNDYFLAAEACEVTYVMDNGAENNQCSCVTNADNNECYSFANINNCHKLVEKLPGAMKGSLSFCVICLFLSILIFIISLIAYYKPAWIQSQAERDEANALAAAPRVAGTPVYLVSQAVPATVVTPNPMV